MTYNDETDPNDLLDLMKPGEDLANFRVRIGKFYWRVHNDLIGASIEDIELYGRLHRFMGWFGVPIDDKAP